MTKHAIRTLEMIVFGALTFGAMVTLNFACIPEAHAQVACKNATATSRGCVTLNQVRAVAQDAGAGGSAIVIPNCLDINGQHLNSDAGQFYCGGDNVDGGTNELWHTIGASGEPAYENSWTNYDTATYYAGGFRKVAGNRVEMRGLIKSGTVDASGVANMVTVPVSYRPSKVVFGTSTSSGAALGTVRIGSNGGVCITTGSNTWFSLDGVSWSLDP